jgi:hypothetical protein
MKVLPHKSPRSRGEAKTPARRSQSGRKKCEVQPPNIFVEVASKDWRANRHAPAKIRVRRGCYRYLVWRDGLLKCEFYLGKIKNLTPQASSRPGAPARTSSSCSSGPTGVQK